MNNNQIDVCAISYINIAIAKCNLLMPYIKFNDKTPVWDGEIQLYGNAKHTRDYVRNIPVQVKGTTLGDIKRNTLSFKVDISDLRNFSETGGAVYFVVMIKGNKHRIYYRMLLPQDIQPLLKNILNQNDKQESTSLQFIPFPTKKNEIIALMKHFIENTNVGRKVYSIDELLNEKQEFTITHSGIMHEKIELADIEQIARFLNNRNTYSYLIPNNLPDERIPLEKYEDVQVVVGTDLPKVKNINISRVSDGEATYYHIGANPEPYERSITLKPDGEKMNIDVEIRGTLQQQLFDMEYLLNSDNIFSGKIADEHKTMLTERAKLLSTIKRVLEYCGIADDIDFSNLSNDERRQLIGFTKMVDAEHEATGDENAIVMNVFSVLGKDILLYEQKTGNRWKWVNPFVDLPRIRAFDVDSEGNPDNERAVIISMFYVCDHSLYRKFSNTDYDKVYKALTNSDVSSVTLKLALLTQCSIIQAFDSNASDVEVLELALRFSEWLISNTEPDDDIRKFIFINKQQIIKRRDGYFSSKDYSMLTELLSYENNEVRFAVYTLLDDKEKAQTYYEKMNDDDKEQYSRMPIYTLYRYLMDEAG